MRLTSVKIYVTIVGMRIIIIIMMTIIIITIIVIIIIILFLATTLKEGSFPARAFGDLYYQGEKNNGYLMV